MEVDEQLPSALIVRDSYVPLQTTYQRQIEFV